MSTARRTPGAYVYPLAWVVLLYPLGASHAAELDVPIHVEVVDSRTSVVSNQGHKGNNVEAWNSCATKSCALSCQGTSPCAGSPPPSGDLTALDDPKYAAKASAEVQASGRSVTVHLEGDAKSTLQFPRDRRFSGRTGFRVRVFARLPAGQEVILKTDLSGVVAKAQGAGASASVVVNDRCPDEVRQTAASPNDGSLAESAYQGGPLQCTVQPVKEQKRIIGGEEYFLVQDIDFSGSAGANVGTAWPQNSSFSGNASLSFKLKGKMLRKFGGNGQSMLEARASTSPMTVQVIEDEDDSKLVTGETVQFSTSSTPPGGADAFVSPTSGKTGATGALKGKAQTRLTFGNATGPYKIKATCSGCVPLAREVEFDAAAVTVESVAALREVFCDGSGFTGELMMNPLRVQAYNTLIPSEGFAGFAVSFKVTTQPGASDATLSETAVTTSDSPKRVSRGMARTQFTLGSDPGGYVVQANCPNCQRGKTVQCLVLGITKTLSRYPTPAVPVMFGGFTPVSPLAPDVSVSVNPPQVVPVDAQGNAIVSGPITASVAIEGPPNADCTAFLFPNEFTGGHQHNSTRPKGTLTGICHLTSEGNATLQYRAGEIGGQERIVVDFSGVGQYVGFVNVRVPGLEKLGKVGPTWRTASGDATHPNFDYVAPAMKSILQQVSAAYLQVKGSLLSFNDMSLVNGGLFDIGGTWTNPHVSHRKGTSVDVNHGVSLPAGSVSRRPPPQLDEAALNTRFKALGCGRCIESGSIHFECPATALCPKPN